MITTLSPRQSRALAGAILVLVLSTAVVLLIYPVWSMNEALGIQIDDTLFQIQRYKRIATQNDQYQLEFNNIKQSQQTDQRYLQSKTESLANAELQRRIKQLVAAGQGEIISTQTSQISQEEMLNRVAIRVRMKSTLEGLKTILHRIETQKPYLFIDNITIRSRHITRRGLPKTKKIVEAMRMLDVDFHLLGYIKSGES